MRVLVRYLRWYVPATAAVYAALFALGRFFYPLPETHIFHARELYNEHLVPILIFSACWIVVMIAIYVLLSRNLAKDFKEIFLHMGAIAMLGPLCEVALNTAYAWIFGAPLWVYHFLPVHDGDTSMYSFFVWAMYGCHLYFIDRRFIHTSAPFKTILFAMVLSVDAVLLEFTVNITSVYYLHTYIFYYFPNDIYHLTTLAVVPVYFIGGLLAGEVLRRTLKHPIVFGSAGFLVGFVFTFSFALLA